MSNDKPLTIFETISGSRLYGTNLPDSDFDYRGVAIEPMNAILGLGKFEQLEQKTPDRVIFGLKKFLLLALECNPNILEILFSPRYGETCVLTTPTWNYIAHHADFFVSKLVEKKFIGYAYSEMMKMERHHRWLTTPPEQPNPEDYGLYHDASGASKWKDKTWKNEYDNLKREWENYTRWMTERNPARAETERKVGYDTKNGYSLVRILNEGFDLWRTGEIKLPRTYDQEFLIEIRQGKYSYEFMKNYFEKMKNEFKTWNTNLPEHGDYEFVERILMGIYRGRIND